jgi:hypothetical protein
LDKRYGNCVCHNRYSSLNAKGLCPEGARERNNLVAINKGFVIKENDGYRGIEIITNQVDRGVQESNEQIQSTQRFDKKKAYKINYRSEKGKATIKAELLLFQKIFKERPHFCEVTGKPIIAFDIRCFSHVLTKGAYPKFRLYEKNIVFCLPDKHFEWEFKTRKTLEFSWIETLESALKTEYYRKK